MRSSPGVLVLPIPQAVLTYGLGGHEVGFAARPPLDRFIHEEKPARFPEIAGGWRRSGLSAGPLTIQVELVPNAKSLADCIEDYVNNSDTMISTDQARELQAAGVDHPAVSIAGINRGSAVRIYSSDLEVEPGNTTDYLVFESGAESTVLRLSPTHFLIFDWELIEWSPRGL